MKNELLNQYKILVNFLGKTLGPSFEIVLHEIKGEEVKMIAIRLPHATASMPIKPSISSS